MAHLVSVLKKGRKVSLTLEALNRSNSVHQGAVHRCKFIDYDPSQRQFIFVFKALLVMFHFIFGGSITSARVSITRYNPLIFIFFTRACKTTYFRIPATIGNGLTACSGTVDEISHV